MIINCKKFLIKFFRFYPLPSNPVIIPIIARSAPEGVVLPVEENGVDGAGGSRLEIQPIAHLGQLVSDPLGDGFVQREASWPGFVFIE